jgi:hypothetical protein
MKLDMDWVDYLPLRRLKAQMGIPLEPLQGSGWGDPPPETEVGVTHANAAEAPPAGIAPDTAPDRADPAAE